MGSLLEQEEPPSVVAERDYLIAAREKSARVILTKREEEKTGRGSRQPARGERGRFISTAERFSSTTLFECARALSTCLERAKRALTPTIPAPCCLPVKQYLPGFFLPPNRVQ